MGWRTWTCLAGVGLGLLGLEYTRKRRDAIARARLREEADREDEPVLAEPEAAPVESEPVRAQPVPVRAEPKPVPGEPEPARVEEPERMAPEPEPVRREPIRAEAEPVRSEPEPVRVESESVATKPLRPTAAGIGSRADPDGEPLEVTTSDWMQAGLLDVKPPVPGPVSPSRRARHGTRPEEAFDDPDEPLLPIRHAPAGPPPGRPRAARSETTRRTKTRWMKGTPEPATAAVAPVGHKNTQGR